MSENVRLQVETLRELGQSILKRHGTDDEHAAQVVDVLLNADVQGVVAHGLSRLPGYIDRVKRGLLDPNAQPTVAQDGDGLLLLDANNGYGQVAAIDATMRAVERARRYGSAWVVTRGANHFGIAGYYARLAAQRGVATIAMSNVGPSMAAYGGREAVLGTNPIAMAVPGEPEPVCHDMAVSQVSRGKIRRAKAEGRAIPEGWALDAEGQPTTDPVKALAGTMAPLGAPVSGHKGYGLAVMVDMFTGLISGGAFGRDVRSMDQMDGTAGTSFTIIAADIGRIGDRDDYFRRTTVFRSMLEASAGPGGSVKLPGDIENERKGKAMESGLELPFDVYQALQALNAS